MDVENIVSDMPAVDTVDTVDTVATSIDTQTTQGFFQKTFNGFSFDSFLGKIGLSRDNLAETALYCGGGFVLGFFFKKYNHYFVVMALFGVALLVAHYFNIISLTINTETIKSLLGCPTLPLDGSLFSCLMQWIKEHVRASVSFVIGFIIGVWVG